MRYWIWLKCNGFTFVKKNVKNVVYMKFIRILHSGS